MEDADIFESWDWQSEGFGLDTDSPLGRSAISHCLWDDLPLSEIDTRTPFASTPASEIILSEPSSGCAFEKHVANSSSGQQYVLEDSPRLKRRRMLLFPGEQQPEHNACCNPPIDSLPELLERCNDSFLEACEEFRMLDPTSPSSIWYLTNDESLSSVDDAVEQSAESWMARYLSGREARACQSQTSKLVPVTGIADCNAIDRQGDGADGGQIHLAPFHSRRTIPATQWKPPLHTRSKLATPVAYPFAVVKPSGTQGDVTLNDINQRILMPPSRHTLHLTPAAAAAEDASRSGSMSPGATAMSGKSVVALTKIHTEGKGTITIMRTRN